MKKILFVIMMVLAGMVYGQEKEKRDWVDGFLEVGASPFAAYWKSASEVPGDIRKEWIFYTTINIEIKPLKWCFFGGQVQTFFLDLKNEKTFDPLICDFLVFVGFRFWYIEIGFNHYCSHPLNTRIYNTVPIFNSNRAYEEIYIRLSF